jgi:hypothetical protein
MAMSFLAAATALLPTITSLLDKVIPDPEARAKAQLDLLRLQQEGAFKELDMQLQVNLAQAEINKVEAASQNGFQAGWRPLAGYACVAGLGYEFLLRPLLPWCLTVSGVEAPQLPSLDGVLFELMFGMLGLGTLRSADRWSRAKTITKLNGS